MWFALRKQRKEEEAVKSDRQLPRLRPAVLRYPGSYLKGKRSFLEPHPFPPQEDAVLPSESQSFLGLSGGGALTEAFCFPVGCPGAGVAGGGWGMLQDRAQVAAPLPSLLCQGLCS